jgi:hypothetical protein
MANMGDMAALRELREKITEGWRVKITDHDYANDGRDGTVEKVTDDGLVIRPDHPWSSQGRKFRTMNFTWGGDMDVEGATVRLCVVPSSTTSRSTKGVRRLVKTFKFTPPTP